MCPRFDSWWYHSSFHDAAILLRVTRHFFWPFTHGLAPHASRPDGRAASLVFRREVSVKFSTTHSFDHQFRHSRRVQTPRKCGQLRPVVWITTPHNVENRGTINVEKHREATAKEHRRRLPHPLFTISHQSILLNINTERSYQQSVHNFGASAICIHNST